MQRPVQSSNWLKAFVDIVLLIWNTIAAAPYRTCLNLRTPILVPIIVFLQAWQLTRSEFVRRVLSYLEQNKSTLGKPISLTVKG